MTWNDLPWRPSSRTLRQFAGLWLLVFGALACRHALVPEHRTAAWGLGVLALTVGPLGLLYPRALRPLFVGWIVLVFPVGWLVSRVTLGLMFYGLFAPLGLLFRAFGRDPLALRRPAGRNTYWIPKAQAADARSYLHQY
jgi:hypothetical protein